MYYSVQSEKNFDRVSSDLEAAFKRHCFGILHSYNLGVTARNNGSTFNEQCKIFEICSPGLLAKYMPSEIPHKVTEPRRVTVFTEQGKTRILLSKRATLDKAQKQNDSLRQLVQEIEDKLIHIINEAK